MRPTPLDRRVAIVTGASQGIGASLRVALRAEGYAVVATSRSIHASQEHDFITVRGDITHVETARQVVDQAIARFGRIVNITASLVDHPLSQSPAALTSLT